MGIRSTIAVKKARITGSSGNAPTSSSTLPRMTSAVKEPVSGYISHKGRPPLRCWRFQPYFFPPELIASCLSAQASADGELTSERSDNEFYLGWDRISESRDLTKSYLDEWVYGLKDREEYWQKLGAEKHAALKIASRPSETVDYGQY